MFTTIYSKLNGTVLTKSIHGGKIDKMAKKMGAVVNRLAGDRVMTGKIEGGDFKSLNNKDLNNKNPRVGNEDFQKLSELFTINGLMYKSSVCRFR